jgi:hypothetical protein
MENNNQGQNTCGMCGGCSHCHGGHHRFHLLRWVLGLVIILMVFSFGVQIGEFKSAFENGQGYSGGHMMRYGYQPNMMYGSGQIQVVAPSAVTGTVKK